MHDGAPGFRTISFSNLRNLRLQLRSCMRCGDWQGGVIRTKLKHFSGALRLSDAIDRVDAVLASRYRLEREIGRGGMATVYLADDQKHHRPVAVKIPRKSGKANADVGLLRTCGISTRKRGPTS